MVYKQKTFYHVLSIYVESFFVSLSFFYAEKKRITN